jgi:hypothetical protein
MSFDRAKFILRAIRTRKTLFLENVPSPEQPAQKQYVLDTLSPNIGFVQASAKDLDTGRRNAFGKIRARSKKSKASRELGRK